MGQRCTGFAPTGLKGRLGVERSMKAMVYDNYGSPEELELQQIDVPRAHDDQVLVRVHAASVNWLDWHFLTGRPFMARIMAGGLLRPRHKVLGVDLAGQVQAVGPDVKRFRPSDAVFGSTSHGANAQGAITTQTFTYADVACVGFAQYWGVGPNSASEGTRNLYGYYCADPGEPLSEAQASALGNSIVVRE